MNIFFLNVFIYQLKNQSCFMGVNSKEMGLGMCFTWIGILWCWLGSTWHTCVDLASPIVWCHVEIRTGHLHSVLLIYCISWGQFSLVTCGWLYEGWHWALVVWEELWLIWYNLGQRDQNCLRGPSTLQASVGLPVSRTSFLSSRLLGSLFNRLERDGEEG